MGQFTQEEQTQIVKGALELTATIQYEQNESRKLQAQTFRKLPEPPVKETLPPVECVQPQYPAKPKSNYAYMDFVKETLDLSTTKRKIGAIAIVLLAGWLIGVFFIYSLYAYLKKIKQLNSELENSPEYLEARADAERIAKEIQAEREHERSQKQAQLDAKYQKEKEHYDNVIVPEYNEELKNWSNHRRIKLEILQKEIALNTETLTNLYEATKIISSHYRELWILDWLYEEMSTSDHDIRYATELLDRDRQLEATKQGAYRTQQAITRMEHSMLAGFGAVYNAIEAGNELQSDTLSLLSKTRRDTNIGNFIGTVQRHNTNKMLKDIL